MKFNEKLINLRKQKGLSQEELGYKLNVTRQTVSKWELGETTPEMNKLVEMSKIFGIGLDELTNEEVKIEDKPINEKPIKDKSTLKVIILIVAITAIFLAIVCFLVISGIFKFFNFGKNMTEKVLDKGNFGKNMTEEVLNTGKEMVSEIQSHINQLEYDNIEEMDEQQEKQ